MPRAAANARSDRSSASDPFQLAGTRSDDRSRLPSTTCLRLVLTRLAGAGAQALPEAEARTRPARHGAPNLCEFDYDHYVALQNRRRHQPSRPNHAAKADRQD